MREQIHGKRKLRNLQPPSQTVGSKMGAFEVVAGGRCGRQRTEGVAAGESWRWLHRSRRIRRTRRGEMPYLFMAHR